MLSLNHLSLVDGVDEGAALARSARAARLDRVRRIRGRWSRASPASSSRRVVGRAGGAAAGGFCRGVEVTLQLDEEKFTGGGLYLFASVLDRFLGLYATINSFTRTRVATNRREGVLCEWPPRAAEQVLA